MIVPTRTLGALCAALALCAAPVRAQVLFQHFYYPTPDLPDERSWWRQASQQLAELARIGVWGVWHPVPAKGGSGRVSMGYDPYDLYDLGSKSQKGTIATHFGTRDEYLAYVATAHANGLRAIADVVLNHANGADEAQPGPIRERLGWDDIDDRAISPEFYPPGYDPNAMNLRGWTGFLPRGADGKRGTGRFPRDWRHFHPSPVHPDHNGPYHHPDFGQDYCFEADNGYVGRNLRAWSDWFQDQSGVDGYRLDAVKLMEPKFLAGFTAQALGRRPSFWMVGEFWDTNASLLADFQKATGQRMKLFDFSLYYALKDLAEKPDFDLRDLLRRRFADRSHAVSFVSNHDVDRDQPIPRTRRALPYALILAMDGQPSIFYRDYFQPEDPALPETLRTLIAAHNRYAWGAETVRLAERDCLVLERAGGLVAIFCKPGRQQIEVTTGFPNGRLRAVAGGTVEAATDAKGTLKVDAPEDGYLYLAPAHPPRRDNARSFPRSTTQAYFFADDLDRGALGSWSTELKVRAQSGTPLRATLTCPGGAGALTIQIHSPSGRRLATGQGKRIAPVSAVVPLAPETGEYRLTLAAPGLKKTAARLWVTYTAPGAGLP